MNDDPVQKKIDEARAKGHWLNASYQDLWFSPGELEAARAGGRVRWGAESFEVRDPRQHLEHLARQSVAAQQRVFDFAVRAGLDVPADYR